MTKPSIDEATPQGAIGEVIVPSATLEQLRTQNAALREALEKISERPHESTCVSEMGYECDCPIGIADAALEEVK